MKQYDYTFTLTEEDYLQYLRYVVATSKDSKRKGWWLRLSVPILAIFTVYFFHLYTYWYAIVIAIAVSLLWLLFISDRIFESFLYRKVNRNFMQNLKVQKFKPVHVQLLDEGIQVDKQSIRYVDLVKVLPLKDIVIFFHNQPSAFLIPLRTIGTLEDASALIAFTDFMKEKQQNAIWEEEDRKEAEEAKQETIEQ